MSSSHIFFCQRREFFFFFMNLFIYFWLHWVFVAAHSLSLVVASGGYSSLWCTGFSLQWLLLLRSTGSRLAGFSSCGMRAQQLWLAGPRAQTQQLWCMGLVASRHVGSSWTRARTCVPCIDRQILNHCTTREVPKRVFLIFLLFCFALFFFGCTAQLVGSQFPDQELNLGPWQ